MTLSVKFNKQFNGLDESVIASYEQQWGIKLPDSYRNFLLNINGGIPEKKGFRLKDNSDSSLISVFFGIVDEGRFSLTLKYLCTYKNRIPRNTLPIANDQLGNLILLSVSGSDYGKVYFWDHNWEAEEWQEPDYSNLSLIEDSFEEFINNLESDDEEETK